MPRRAALLAALLGSCIPVIPATPAAAQAPAKSAASDLPKVPFEKYTLANGLEVILSRDAGTPLVAVNLWYHVGPADEEPGRTGFAHLFEHMMFQCSRHVPCDSHFKILEGAGASEINGTTDFDRTNYFQTVPANQLELALWLESDRMGWLLDTLTLDSFMNQQDVVRNERRQSVENAPYGMAQEELFHLLFPKEHPYYASVIGSHADIQAATLENVKSFFKQFYTPNNATLAIVGDFDPSAARALVEKYFGTIKRGPEVRRHQVATPPITGERRAVVKDAVELEQVQMGWITPPAFAAGSADGDACAQLLGGGKSSRLYKSLVYEKQIATAVSATHYPLGLGSLFGITATARPGHTAAELEKAIDAELEALRKGGPQPAEIERAVNTIETGIVQGLERVGGFGGVADRLNTYNHYLKDPGYLPKDVARYRAVTPASVRAFAQEHLKSTARAVVTCVPGQPDFGAPVPTPPPVADAGKQGAESVNAPEEWRAKQPEPGAARLASLPAAKSARLSNGLTLIVDNRPRLPVVAASLVVRAGLDANTIDKPGLASFTAGLLDEGTRTRTAGQIADEAARLGATLAVNAGTSESTVLVTSLKKTFAEALALAADVAVNPSFPAEEVERARSKALAELVQERDEPGAVARNAFRSALFGSGHPQGLNPLGTEASIKAFTRADAENFWKARYAPANAALVVAGDITLEELKPLAEKAFGGWAAAGGSLPELPEPRPTASKVVIVDKPGAQQTAVRVGALAPRRSTPDYNALQIMNEALGGLFSSRINLNLREEHGYTYGAGSAMRLGTRGPGVFVVSSGVRTDVTGPAIGEIVKEIKRMAAEPLTGEELTLSKDSASRSLPGLFETAAASVFNFADAYVNDLGLDYFQKQPAAIAAVDIPAVSAAAAKHLKPDAFIIVAVGDKEKILPQIQALNLGAIEFRDAEGNLKSGAPAR